MRSSVVSTIVFFLLSVLFFSGCSIKPEVVEAAQPSNESPVPLQIVTFEAEQAPSPTAVALQAPEQINESNTIANDENLSIPSAASAAVMLRMDESSAPIFYWETAQPDASNLFRKRKAVHAMLACAVGNGIIPVGREGIQFQQDPEVPLIAEGESLPQGSDFNIRGSVYANSPLTSVTASFIPVHQGEDEIASVTFAPSDQIEKYSLDTKSEHSARSGIGDSFDISGLPVGQYTFTLTATSVDITAPITLYQANCTISDIKDLQLTQNKFDDNYLEVFRFFQGDTSKFLFRYWIRDSRSISTDSNWRDATIVESSLGRVNIAAVPNFELANYYLEHSYVSVTIINRKLNRQTDGRVTLLSDLISKEATYVPRFQSNMQYISHHTLGLAIDVNDDMYPNKNIVTNHDLIGNDVRDHLIYNGILTDAEGRQYYDFTYDGSYSPRFKRVPKSIINYLLYELAVYRAGFQWGYYYETTCDGMHFTLAEFDVNKHMYSDVGLRKVYEYVKDENEPTLTSLRNALLKPAASPIP